MSRRSGGLFGLEIAAADDATCPNESDVCCSNEEIVHDCSEYKADGYKCLKACFDTPQDFVPENERKSKISPYLPNEAKCPQRGRKCCKRAKKLIEKFMPENAQQCEDASPGYKCLDFENCDPNKIFFSKKPDTEVKD